MFYLFLERGEGKEKERERNTNAWLPLAALPTGDLTQDPGICPDWESNLTVFGSQASTQSTVPHQLGLLLVIRVYWPSTLLVGYISPAVIFVLRGECELFSSQESLNTYHKSPEESLPYRFNECQNNFPQNKVLVNYWTPPVWPAVIFLYYN